MIEQSMKEQCDKRFKEIEKDEKYQSLMNDLRSTMLIFRNSQDERIRNANRSRVTKDGTRQKNYDEFIVSKEQKEFNEVHLKVFADEEKRATERLNELVKLHPVYTRYLKNISGMGPIMSAVLLTQFKVEKIYYVSSLYAFAGIVKGHDKLIKGQKAEFNTFLKKKLLGVLGPGFIKTKSEYAEYYYLKRIQLINRDNVLIKEGKMSPSFTETPDGMLKRTTAKHQSLMANRYMIQMFVRDYYVAFRQIMNIPVVPFYETEYLDLTHVGTNVTTVEQFLDKDYNQSNKKAVRTKTKERLESLKKILTELSITSGYKNSSEEDDVNAITESEDGEEEK